MDANTFSSQEHITIQKGNSKSSKMKCKGTSLAILKCVNNYKAIVDLCILCYCIALKITLATPTPKWVFKVLASVCIIQKCNEPKL